MTAPATTTPAARVTATPAQLEAIAAAARAWFAEVATLADDPREWSDPQTGRTYVRLLRAGRAWARAGAVHARVPGYSYTACDALDAAVNAVLPAAIRPGCYLAESAGAWTAYFGTAAARAFGAWTRDHRACGTSAATSQETLAAWLSEPSTDPAYLAELFAAYTEEITR